MNGRSFYVSKTDLNGDFSGPDEFFRNFKIYKDVNCNVFNTNVSQNAGISAIETGNILTPSSGARYALVTSVKDINSGDFLVFATLDQSGNIVTSAFYNYPGNNLPIFKPKIVESMNNPGDYYICSAYDIYTYVTKVNINGTVIWSRRYASGNRIEGRDLIESPFNSNELIVVGTTVTGGLLGQGNDAFFLKVSSSNGNIINFKTYYNDPFGSEHQIFNCISPAFSNTGGNGFVVAGFSDDLQGNSGLLHGTLIMKLDKNGSIIWNTIVQNDNNTLIQLITGQAASVFERYSILQGYTYYCSASLANESRVYKLDDFGNLYPTGQNQYSYNSISPTVPNLYQTYMTKNESNIGSEGLQIFSTDGGGNMKDYYMTKSYFDGNALCNQNLSIGIQGPGPAFIDQPSIIVGVGINTGVCSGFTIISSPWIISPVAICGIPVIPGASNDKVSNLSIPKAANSKFEIFPNPNFGEFDLFVDSSVSFELTDLEGRTIIADSIRSNNTFHFKSDLLSAGVYNLSISNNEFKRNKKVVVLK